MWSRLPTRSHVWRSMRRPRRASRRCGCSFRRMEGSRCRTLLLESSGRQGLESQSPVPGRRHCSRMSGIWYKFRDSQSIIGTCHGDRVTTASGDPRGHDEQQTWAPFCVYFFAQSSFQSRPQEAWPRCNGTLCWLPGNTTLSSADRSSSKFLICKARGSPISQKRRDWPHHFKTSSIWRT